MTQTDLIDRLRRFNRFYTRRLGLLSERPYGGDFTLTEVRVLFELAHEGPLKPSWLVGHLGLDPAYVSRILKRFGKLGLVDRARDPDDGRGVIVTLTQEGREVFAPLDAASREGLAAMVGHLDDRAKAGLIDAVERVEGLLTTPRGYRLRDLEIGDIGHITSRQALIYAGEYGWDISYEALVARLFADFVTTFDPAKEASFVAVDGGTILGSVFLFRGDDEGVAKLRLLYVEPGARGLGLGRALVDACIDAARARGYRRLVLWTQDCLVSARRIYTAAGFERVSQQANPAFGKVLNSQVWALGL